MTDYSYFKSPIQRMKEIYPSLHQKEKKIADTISSHSNQIGYLSIKELAKLCGTAESSVVRFCKLLGYTGYSEFKLELIKSSFTMSSFHQNAYTEAAAESSQDNAETITRRLLTDTVQLLNRLPEQLDYSAIEAAANAICSSSALFLYGYIYSGQIALVFQERMKALGIPTFLAWDHISMRQNSRLAGADSVSLFLSHSGASKDSVENARQVRENGSRILVLTTDANAPLARLADILILIPLSTDSLFRDYYPTELAFQMILAAICTDVSRQLKTSNLTLQKTEALELEILKNAILPLEN